MDFIFFLKEVKNIIFNPARAWESIDSENRPIKLVRNSLLLPLIVLVSAAAFIGSFRFINSELSPVYSILVGIKCFCLMNITVYATAFILTEITYPLDLGKDFNISFRIVVYSVTPFLLCQILSRLFESLQFVNIISVYGLYIFWAGSEKLLSPAQHKKMPMLIATTISIAGIYVAFNYVLTALTDKVYYAFFA